MVWTYLCRIAPTCSPVGSHQDTPPWWNDRGRCRHSYRRRCHRRHQTSRWDRLKQTRRFILNRTKRFSHESIGLSLLSLFKMCVPLYLQKLHFGPYQLLWQPSWQIPDTFSQSLRPRQFPQSNWQASPYLYFLHSKWKGGNRDYFIVRFTVTNAVFLLFLLYVSYSKYEAI